MKFVQKYVSDHKNLIFNLFNKEIHTIISYLRNSSITTLKFSDENKHNNQNNNMLSMEVFENVFTDDVLSLLIDVQLMLRADEFLGW